MQTTMAPEEIKPTLAELLDRLTPGDEVILTRDQQPVAMLVSERPSSSTGCVHLPAWARESSPSPPTTMNT